jgi:3-oxoadipate enol-lactonase
MPSITIEGLRFYYQQAGEGPDVVLIHAVTSNMTMWMFSGIMEDLSANFRVTAYDLRGHGMSDCPPSGYTSREMAQDLKKLFTALDLQSAYLIGHSFGGCIAMQAALLYPEIVEGVVISDTYFPGLCHLEPMLHQMPMWKKWCEMFGRVGADVGEKVDFKRLFQVVQDLTPEQLEALEKERDPLFLRWLNHLARLAKTSCGEDIFHEAGLSSEKIRTVNKPIFALYDEHTAFQATRDFFESLPNCVVESIPAANHFAPLENPTVFSNLVQKYLASRRVCIS